MSSGPSTSEVVEKSMNDYRNSHQTQRADEAANIVKQRNDDLASGEARGNQIFGAGSMGRVDADRSGEVNNIINQRQQQAQGFSKEEQNAMRDQNLGSINQSQAGAMRQMKIQQAQSGARGALAANQRSKLLSDGQGQMVGAERDLFLKNIDARRSGLDSLEKTTAGARADELGRQQFNIDQTNREKMGQLTTQLGYAGLGAGERAALLQKVAGEDNAAATRAMADKQGCCFIFLESRYGNGTMDSVVRRFRDENMNEQNRRGYYKLSEVFVPLMRKSKLFKFCVSTVMTGPLVSYGKAYYKTGSSLGLAFKPVVNFWLGLFSYLGKDHQFIRENGEVV